MHHSPTFDIVIPFHPKDEETLSLCVSYAQKHVIGRDQIFLLGRTPIQIEGTQFVPEDRFDPIYTKSRIRAIWHHHYPPYASRAGWIYQQFLKLGAGLVIEGLNTHYLCIDADTLFLRPVTFLNGEHTFLYLVAREYHLPYLHTYERLMAEKTVAGFSFISHHMMFDQLLLKALFNHIETLHGMSWCDAIMQSINYHHRSNFSEWDLYGNWVLKTRPEIARHRPLDWTNISYIPDADQAEDLGKAYHFVSAHAYSRANRRQYPQE